MWPTPTSRDWKDGSAKACANVPKNGQLGRQVHDGRLDWFIEPDVGRVAHGVPARVDRLRALGNAVVPQIPEIIGRAIMSLQQVSRLKEQLVPTEQDYERARQAIHEAWDNCKMVNYMRVGHPCGCDQGLVAGCKAKVEAIAKAIAEARKI